MAIVNTIYAHKITSANTFVTLVPTSADFIMSTLIVVNTSGTDATIAVRMGAANGSEVSAIIVAEPIEAGESKTLALRSLNVPAQSNQLLVSSSVTGVHFTASGGVKI